MQLWWSMCLCMQSDWSWLWNH